MKFRLIKLYLVFLGFGLTLSYSNCSKVKPYDVPLSNAVAANGFPTDGLTTDPAGTQIIPTLTGKVVTTSTDLKVSGSQLDVILVIDNSGSMRNDSEALASRLGNFVTKLSNSGIDWQMCYIDTTLDASGGLPLLWDYRNSKTSASNKTLVNSATDNFSQVFIDTINGLSFGDRGTGDERGVAALRKHFDRKSEHSCLRPGAATTSIVISDEDERSVGGVEALDPDQYKAIEDIDRPELLLLSAANAGAARYVANSIVVQSGDSTCLNRQNAAGSPSYYGTFYEKLSGLSKGGVGSICDTDFSTHLNLFFDKITTGIQKISLICEIVPGSLSVKVNQNDGTYKYTYDMGALAFELMPDLTYHIDLTYTCK